VVLLAAHEVSGRYAAASLSGHGCIVDWRTDVAEFGRDLDGAASAGRPYRVAIVDGDLTDADAYAIGTRVRTEHPDVRLILLTRLGATRANVGASPFDAVLTKPLRQRALGQCVARLLDGRATQADDAARATARTERHVLLVEDNAVNRRVAQHQLQKLGCHVGIATNGAEAVAAWEAREWHLVLMDCQMPVMDGFAATRAIREREPPGRRTPIVALTAHAIQGDREHCLAAGMDDYLTKPFAPAALRDIVERWTAEPADAPGADAAPTPAAEATPAAAAMADARPPVDLAALEEMTGGDVDFVRELIDVFVEAGDRELAGLVAALAADDLAAVRRHAHSLKGASANMRAVSLADVAQRLESAASAGDAAACNDAVRDVQQEFRVATAYLAGR
jgi:CheY-like chemotaxis protein